MGLACLRRVRSLIFTGRLLEKGVSSKDEPSCGSLGAFALDWASPWVVSSSEIVDESGEPDFIVSFELAKQRDVTEHITHFRIGRFDIEAHIAVNSTQETLRVMDSR